MADEEKTEVTDETKADETKAEETKATDTAEQKSEEKEVKISPELIELHEEFDKEIDSDDNAAVEEPAESEEKKPDETEKKVDEKAAEEKKDDTGEKKEEAKKVVKEVVVEQTAEEKEINEAADKLQTELLAESKKSVEQKATEKAAADKLVADEAKAKEGKPFSCGLPTEGEDSYEEELVASIDKMGQEFTDANKVLADENTGLKTMIQQQAGDRFIDWLDRKIDKLGEDFHEVLGKGDLDDLEPASEHYENRQKIADRMSLVAKTHLKLDKKVPTQSKLFDQAITYLHNKVKNKSKIEAKTKEDLKERADQTLGTGGRRGQAITADEKVLQTQKDFDKLIDED